MLATLVKLTPFVSPIHEMKKSTSLKKSPSISTFENIQLIKILNKGKFPVYLSHSQIYKKNYAMKIFPSEDGKPDDFFKNEVRFAFLDHPNVIKIMHFDHTKFIGNKGGMSYILMEYAPYGDFLDFIEKVQIQNDEKLVRTYFRQLIQGLEYIHSQGIAHMDLKPENLLLGENYALKIIDFDSAVMAGDGEALSRGTLYYRAPEVMRGKCFNYPAADIYSAGVILFVMMSGGSMPHLENTKVKGVDLQDLLYYSNEKFWEVHSKYQQGNSENLFSSEFKELFNAMTRYRPAERATIDQIKESKWYKGEIYNDKELIKIMERHFQN